jgi:outer membrane lipoprotein-sorting protein
MRRLGVRERWAVPVGAVAVVGVVAVASAVASANSTPSLPARTAAQLLAETGQAGPASLGPLTATVQQTSNLGLPALPTTGQPTGNGPFSGLAGTATTSIWYLNPQHVRIAQVTPMRETDLRLDGRTVWLWDSKTQTATKVVLPSQFSGINGNVALPRLRAGAAQGAGSLGVTVPTPQAAAQQLLKAVGATTIVSVQRNVTVAGRPAYQLSLAPKSSGSLVGQVLIAIDASKHIPLRLEVIPRGSSSPAYEIGFTSLTFGPPAASNFTFTPPPGAKVKTETVPAGLPAGLLRGAGLRGLLGAGLGLPSGWTGSAPAAPAVPPLPGQALRQLRAQILAHLPKNVTKAEREKIIRSLTQKAEAVPSAGNGSDLGGVVSNDGNVSFALVSPAENLLPAASPGGARIIGTGWLSVLATAPNPALAAEVALLTGGRGPAVPQSSSVSSGSVVIQSSTGSVIGVGNAASSTVSVAGSPNPTGEFVYADAPGVPVGPDMAVLRALLKAMTPVHGGWGSGRLLRTGLLSVLITSNGRILAGPVTPAVLYADAALPVK